MTSQLFVFFSFGETFFSSKRRPPQIITWIVERTIIFLLNWPAIRSLISLDENMSKSQKKIPWQRTHIYIVWPSAILAILFSTLDLFQKQVTMVRNIFFCLLSTQKKECTTRIGKEREEKQQSVVLCIMLFCVRACAIRDYFSVKRKKTYPTVCTQRTWIADERWEKKYSFYHHEKRATIFGALKKSATMTKNRTPI